MSDELILRIAREIWCRVMHRVLDQAVFFDRQELKFKVAYVDGVRYQRYISEDRYELMATYNHPDFNLVLGDVRVIMESVELTSFQKQRKYVWVGK